VVEKGWSWVWRVTEKHGERVSLAKEITSWPITKKSPLLRDIGLHKCMPNKRTAYECGKHQEIIETKIKGPIPPYSFINWLCFLSATFVAQK
jgi:hypothetical protein